MPEHDRDVRPERNPRRNPTDPVVELIADAFVELLMRRDAATESTRGRNGSFAR